MEHYIDVIFEHSCSAPGHDTVQWLKSSGTALESQPPLVTESGFTTHHLTAQREIAMDSVIVFLSGEAALNEDWRAFVTGIPEQVRLIPVERSTTEEYSSEGRIPARIGEVNFIRLDGNERANLLDSLVTDPEFYTMKNHLLFKCRTWQIAHYKGELLTEKKSILAYKAVILKKMTAEKDAGLLAQLKDISSYLDASEQYARRLARQKFLRLAGRGLLASAAVLLMIGFYKAAEYFRRISFSNIALSVDVEAGDPESGAVKMIEALTNPFSEAPSKKIAYDRLVDFMDFTWTQTPVGMNYNDIILDLAIPDGSQYVWTATQGGHALCWDTYTGQIVENETLAADPLPAIAEGNGSLAALDASGCLHLFGGSSRRDIQTAGSLEPSLTKLRLSGEYILLFDSDSAELAGGSGDIKIILPPEEGRTVLTAGFADGKPLIVCADGGNLVLFCYESEALRQTFRGDIPVTSFSLADTKDGTVIMTDRDGQVWQVRDGQAQRTALLLPQGISLSLINDHTAAYLERNMGLGIYDLKREFDYGDLFTSLSGAKDLRVSEGLLAADVSACWQVVSLADILPANPEPAVPVEAEYSSRRAEADLSVSGGKGLGSAEIAENGLLFLSVTLQDSEEAVTVLVDPARVLNNEAGHLPDETLAAVPDEFACYEDEPFSTDGLPTVAGIRYVPANEFNKKDYYYLLIGASDGSFTELAADPAEGTMVRTCSHTIPSRAPVTAILQTPDGYLLKDEAGLLWPCRSGINNVTERGMIANVRAKLRSAVTTQMKDAVSSDVWKALDLEIFPGGDGKWWG